MSYIKFNKEQLINLEFSLTREILRSNRAGAYASQTIIGCNTRKYHGLLICPQPNIDDDNHLLLSNLDESIIEEGNEFNLAIRRYKGGIYNPKGHKYAREYEINHVPVITYRIGNIVLTKEIVFAMNDDRVLIKYTLVDGQSPTKFRFKPFLAFRNIHFLTHANLNVDTNAVKIPGGIMVRMYKDYTPLYMQFSKENFEYLHVPDWYYNIEYVKEIERGYEAHEDLFTPGYFEVNMRKGESIVFSAGTSEVDISKLKVMFSIEVRRRLPRNNFLNCLKNAAQQFIVHRDGKTQLIAGYPYFGRFSRDTFVSLPGLTLTTGNSRLCHEVLQSHLSELKGPLFPNILSKEKPVYNSIDAPLWFIWAVQQYANKTRKLSSVWMEFGPSIKQILEGFREGTEYNIHMQDDGLIYGGAPGIALTWMDAIIEGVPITPRIGCPVEANALWYNGISFAIKAARKSSDKAFVERWLPILKQLDESFPTKFWDEEKGYLADYIDGNFKDWTMRPNQVIATAMQYTPLKEEIRKQILSKVRRELMTPRGLRTLTPTHPNYKGIYGGNQIERDLAYHQGSAFPWLLGFFAEAYLRIHGKGGLALIKNLYNGFEPEMNEHGLCTISEIYEGDPPHKPAGAISQAWSVSALLTIHSLIEFYEKQ